MTWLYFTELFTLLSLYLWACRLAWATGLFIGEHTRRDSVLGICFSALLACYHAERAVASVKRVIRAANKTNPL